MFLYNDFLTFFGLGVVVVAGTVDWVSNTISYFVETVAERMIVTVFVVISHITLVLFGDVNAFPSSLFYSDLFSHWCLRVRCLRAGVDEFNVSLAEVDLRLRSSPGSLDKLDVLLAVARLSWLSCLGSETFLNKFNVWLTVA